MLKINEIIITWHDNTKIEFCINCEPKDLDIKLKNILSCMNRTAMKEVAIKEDIGELQKNPLRS
ncbi:hypothetical protein [Clostridium estertheticum]|uniref:hypothetical protein n=1 Tax=Clostridium estertheticum TaxID=238834 RepID=UPI001C7CD442|nr:hypothetical protein [Clostridium estertheticum]MBX4266565.1 hypothetical protein [Clostridium estertheticum]WLC88095.1 hypothetical protein KTC95_19070 [Clostridium estertheticum]